MIPDQAILMSATHILCARNCMTEGGSDLFDSHAHFRAGYRKSAIHEAVVLAAELAAEVIAESERRKQAGNAER